MKKITFYIAAFFVMTSMLVVQAQEIGRAPIQQKINNETGVISDALRSVDAFQLASAGNTSTQEYGIFNLDDGTFSPTGAIGTSPFPMAQEEGAAGVTYRVYNDLSFVSVEIPSGVETPLGTITGMTGTPTGLAYDTVNDMMYVLLLDGSNLPHIGTLDVATYVATEVGMGSGMLIAMDFAPDGLLYAPSIDDDSLYSIDPATGISSMIGALGIDINFGQDVSYDTEADMLLTLTSGGTSAYGHYDLTTGAFTELAATDGSQYAVFSTSSLTEFPYIPPTGCMVYEDFEAGMPADWSTEVLVGEWDWTFGTGEVNTGDDFPTNAAIFSDDDAGDGNVNSAILYSAVYDLEATNSTFANFSVYAGFQEFGDQQFSIEVFDGTAWQEVGLYDEDFDPDLQTLSFDATAYLNAAFQVRFIYDDLGGYGWYAGIDDFCLKYDEVPDAPVNDAPADALPIACGDTVSGDTTTATIVEAVEDCDEFPNNPTTSVGIWYTFTGDGQSVTLSTCDQTEYDTSIGIYSGTPGSLVCEAANDDGTGCSGYSSLLEDFPSVDGTVYYVRVYGYSASSMGTFDLTMTCGTAVEPPVNDMVANAITVTDVTFSDTAVDLPNANDEGGDFAGCTFSGLNTVFYKFECTASSVVTTLVANPGSLPGAVFYEAANLNATMDSELTHVDQTTNPCAVQDSHSIETEVGKFYYVVFTNDLVSDVSIDGVNDGDVGLADQVIDGFVMYPNPVEDMLNINAANTIDSIAIYNVLGQEVLKSTPSSTTTEINMSSLPIGAYVVKVQAGEQVGTYNLIKQ